jgi:hypothetical protein
MLNAYLSTPSLVRFAAFLGVLLAGAPAGLAGTIDPANGRITWTVDRQSGSASQYFRDSGRASICDVGVWDQSTYFAKVTFCETLTGWYWKPAYLSYDLMMDDFRDLRDFITSGPEPFRNIVTSIGEVDLYGFDVDAVAGDAAWQCIAFIKGFNREDRGYQQMLIAYFCDDTGQGMTDARLTEALAGFTIEDVFDRFVN